MIMECKRLFVGNLPPVVTEIDLKNEFNAYGNVQHIELKFKENLVDPTNPSYFAFITLEANGKQINQCIDEFSREEYLGRYLTVSVARESFLDRLKREREEANLKKSDSQLAKTDENKIVSEQSTLKKIIASTQSSSTSSSETDSESSSSSDSESNQSNARKINENKIVEPEELIAKKRASISVQNGKIKIQTNSQQPIHIINKKEKNIQNNLDDKGKIADKKRKESMHKMKDQYTKQKLAIQQSLAAVDSNKSRKILFDDGDAVTKADKVKLNNSNKVNLFNEDENEEDINNFQNDFDVKEQFQGAKGQKLMKLQSKFQLDSRFKMDKKFMDEEVEEDIDNNRNKSKLNIEEIEMIENNDDERKWQLSIIEQVVGHKFDSLSEVNRKKLRKTMLRYDPTKREHDKFLKNIEKVTKNITTNPQLTENNETIETNEVSKEQFFRINDDLTNSLKRRGDGFSLLSMFGRHEETNEKEYEDNNEKVLISSQPNAQNNPFKYDSSDTDEDESELTKTNCNKVNTETNEKEVPKGGKITKSGIWTENFFISSDDIRLIEGAEFFKSVKRADDEPKEDYDKIKSKLKNIMNKKINKTKKNLKINNKFLKKRSFKGRK